MDKWLCLAAGGVLGTFARYSLGSTLAVNMLGCFLVGFLDIWAERKLSLVPQMRLLLITGFCGAFTTFSALILENYALLRAGETIRALFNMFGSLAIGLVLFRLGMLLAEYIFN